MASFVFYTTKTLKEIIRSPMKFILIFILPIILVASLSFIYGNQSVNELVGVDHDELIIGYVNNDDLESLSLETITIFESYVNNLTETNNLVASPFTFGFFDHFRINLLSDGSISPNLDSVIMSFQDYDSIESAITAVQNREIAMGLVIDKNFSESFLSGINFKHSIESDVYLTNSSDLLDVSSSIEIIGDFSNSLFTSAYSHFSRGFNKYLEIYTKPNLNTGTIEVLTENISRIEFTEFDSQIPGYLVLVLILGISGSVAILASEREMKTIHRMVLSDYDKKSLILGIALSQLIVTIIEVIMFLGTVYIIGFPLVGSPILILLICILSIMPILGLGFMIVAYIKDPYLAISIPSLLGIPLIFLAGAFIPLPYTPMFGSNHIQIWHINPLYSMAEAFRKVMLFGASYDGVLLELTILSCFGVILLSSGIKLLSNTIYEIE